MWETSHYYFLVPIYCIMDTTAPNMLIGISLVGGIAHVLLYMNNFWNDVFLITAVMVVIMPLVIRKAVKEKKIVLPKIRRKLESDKNKNQTLYHTLRGSCKNCGKLMEDNFLTYCSQSCSFEYYLHTQSQTHQMQNKFQIQIWKLSFSNFFKI